MAGFKIDISIELIQHYYNSYKYNHPDTLCLNDDITKFDLNEFKTSFIKNEEIDGIIGGPPCVGFSTVGDRKPTDPRNMLIYFFIQWVNYFKPKFFVMENVPGILSMAKGKIVEKIIELYKDIGYTCKKEILLAAEYGVPQLRKRVFFIDTLDDAILSLKLNKTNREHDGQKTLFEQELLPTFLTVKDAFSDVINIPPFTENIYDDLSIQYTIPPETEYQKYLRKNSEQIFEHFAPNHSKEVIERISQLKQGDNHASLPSKYKLKGGYPNIYGRLNLKKPADTITGNCGCVSAPGRFIHPTQQRAISVREAARLQSFPDNYRFFGNMMERYRQVGNAVPPLMAFEVAKAIKKIMNVI